jgi:rhombotail lipoprotein
LRGCRALWRFRSHSKGERYEITDHHLLGHSRTRFADRKFVSEIVVIPDYYLKSSRGFEGLQGVQRLYSIDLMALVSYDQVTHRDDNNWSLSYLTIVGAFVIPATNHDVATLVDLAGRDMPMCAWSIEMARPRAAEGR